MPADWLDWKHAEWIGAPDWYRPTNSRAALPQGLHVEEASRMPSRRGIESPWVSLFHRSQVQTSFMWGSTRRNWASRGRGQPGVQPPRRAAITIELSITYDLQPAASGAVGHRFESCRAYHLTRVPRVSCGVRGRARRRRRAQVCQELPAAAREGKPSVQTGVQTEGAGDARGDDAITRQHAARCPR
jgi:hypothetical protein